MPGRSRTLLRWSAPGYVAALGLLAADILMAAEPPRAPETAIADPVAAEPVLPVLLTLEAYLPRFLTVDPTWHIAVLEQTVAGLALARSRDRLALDFEASPGARYDGFVFGTGEPARDVGTLTAGRIAGQLRDRFGGTLTAAVRGTRLTKPALSSGGHQAAAVIEYSLPLLRNAFGRLYDLESAFLDLGYQAREADAEAYLVERCAAGIDLFATAYLVQEQWAVWQELLDLKKKTFERTKRDHARRMVNELDYLAAESDWLIAQQRNEELAAERRRTLVSLRSYLESPAEETRLASPAAVFDATVLPEESARGAVFERHPLARATALASRSYAAQAALVDANAGAELAVVPQVGVDHYSRMFQPPGANAPLTDVSAMVSLVLTLPVIDPDRGYDLRILLERRRQESLQHEEVLRDLTVRFDLAREALREAEARLALNERKREVLGKQLREAAGRFNAGRLEFQDYLIHWSLYEDARFEKLELSYGQWLAQIETIRALGVIPAACRGRGE